MNRLLSMARGGRMPAVAVGRAGGRPTAGARRRSRLWRALSAWLLLAGCLLLADVAATLVWQEPVTALIGLIDRAQVSDRYLSYSDSPLTLQQRGQLRELAGQQRRIAYLALQEQREAPAGAAIGRLQIPSLGVDYYVVQGAGPGELERGPGHYRSTPLPGMGGTVAIAGHRTTYLAPFRNLNLLRPGDSIAMHMPYGIFDYVVTRRVVVAPDAWWILRRRAFDQLVLSACNPLYSATQRIVVFARLRTVTAIGPALRGDARSR